MVIVMSNEQRAHDLTMFYIKMYYDFQKPSENGRFEFDAINKYVELYPQVLKQINIAFPN